MTNLKRQIFLEKAASMKPLHNILSGIPFESPDKPERNSGVLANVTFEPGCRNNWHIHILQAEGGSFLSVPLAKVGIRRKVKQAVSLKPGMVITIPP